MSLAVRHNAKAFPAFIGKMVTPTQQVPERLPDWLTTDTRPSNSEALGAINREDHADAKPAVGCSTSAETQGGTYYEVYIGARLRLFSSKKNEDRLRNMHVVNHRELPIAVLAAWVADYLWPNCQEMVDEAVAKSKDMRKQQALAQEEVYVPPEVPHLLPFTSWIRNNEVIRESFICDKNTRYKPRMSWYNPNDGMIPSGWWKDGLLADLMYYKPLCGTREADQKW